MVVAPAVAADAHTRDRGSDVAASRELFDALEFAATEGRRPSSAARARRASRTPVSIATFVSVTSPADAMSMPAPMSGRGPNFGRSFVDLLVAAMMIVPEVWRRVLGILTDGLRTRRDSPSPLAPAGLAPRAGPGHDALLATRPLIRVALLA